MPRAPYTISLASAAEVLALAGVRNPIEAITTAIETELDALEFQGTWYTTPSAVAQLLHDCRKDVRLAAISHARPDLVARTALPELRVIR